jgi:hypothetical protein
MTQLNRTRKNLQIRSDGRTPIYLELKSIPDLLKKTGLTVDQLVNLINLEGGRDPGKPILFKENCRNCSRLFFSVSQDHYMRIKNGYPVHCPLCREDDKRQAKLNSYHRNKGRP